MPIYSFFDNIENKTNLFSTAVDDYFYLDRLSGKLGHNKFTVITDRQIQKLNNTTHKSPFWRALLNILKVMSYLTGIIPLAFLAAKAIYRKRYQFQLKSERLPINPIVPKLDAATLDAHKKFLQGQWDHFKKFICEKSSPAYQELLLAHHMTGGQSPDDSLVEHNLFCRLENNPDVFVIPANINPANLNNFDVLQKTLSAAFALGKKMVVCRMGNTVHANVGAFQNDGTFKIIDSVVYGTIDMPALNRNLNALKICNVAGSPIQFQGEYINTNLQKYHGRECIRFATLYAYHIAKRQNLDAYQEVNGAFVEGKLKTFEDIKHIAGSKPIRSFSHNGFIDYEPFMISWLFRIYQSENNNSWHTIKISEVQVDRHSNDDALEMIILRKDKPPFPIFATSLSHALKLVFKDSKGMDTPIKNIQSLPIPNTEIQLQPDMT